MMTPCHRLFTIDSYSFCNQFTVMIEADRICKAFKDRILRRRLKSQVQYRKYAFNKPSWGFVFGYILGNTVYPPHKELFSIIDKYKPDWIEFSSCLYYESITKTDRQLAIVYQDGLKYLVTISHDNQEAIIYV